MSSPGGGMKKKSRAGSFLSLTCGCRSNAAVSVAGIPQVPLYSRRFLSLPAETSSEETTATPTTGTASTSRDSEDFNDSEVISSSSSFAGLLRELNELEKSVVSLAPSAEEEEQEEEEEEEEGYVAVVKQTEDPLGDFRKSMLQMIVEKEILGGEELRELLRRFLSLNSPTHHAIIVQAFADIWREVFSGYGGEDVLLRGPLLRRRQVRRDFVPRRRR